MYNRGLYHAKLALPWSGPEPLKRCAAPERGRRPMLTGTTCIQDASALQSQQNALHQLSGMFLRLVGALASNKLTVTL